MCLRHIGTAFLLRYHPSLLGNIKCVQIFYRWARDGDGKGSFVLPSVTLDIYLHSNLFSVLIGCILRIMILEILTWRAISWRFECRVGKLPYAIQNLHLFNSKVTDLVRDGNGSKFTFANPVWVFNVFEQSLCVDHVTHVYCRWWWSWLNV